MYSLLFASLLGGSALAAQPWDGEPFSGSAEAVRTEASLLAARGTTADVLFAEGRVDLDERDRRTASQHVVFRIVGQSGAAWSVLEQPYRPSFQARPVMRARVLTADGRELRVEPGAVTVASPASDPALAPADLKVASLVLPEVGAGAIVELLITVADERPMLDRGVAGVIEAQYALAVGARRLRLTLTAPPGHAPRWDTLNLAAPPRVSDGSDRWRATWEAADVAGLVGRGVGAALTFPLVRYGTGASWREVGRSALAGLRDGLRIDGDAGPRKLPKATVLEQVQRVVSWLQREVRPSAVTSLASTPTLAATPAEVLARRSAEPKELAATLVALLGARGIEAHLAFVHVGLRPSTELPGWGAFDHPLVLVAGERPLWVDPVNPWLPVGQLPSDEQGLPALVLDGKSERLASTPEDEAERNASRAHRRIVYPDEGPPLVSVRQEMSGLLAVTLRAGQEADGGRRLEASVTQAAQSIYNAKPTGLTISEGRDLTGPFTIAFETRWVGARAGLTDVVFDVHRSPVVGIESSLKGNEPDAGVDVGSPFVIEAVDEVVAPGGFVADELPARIEAPLGPLRYLETYTRERDQSVTVRTEVRAPRRHLTADEARAARDAVRELSARQRPRVTFRLAADKLLASNQTAAGVAAFRAAIAAEPTRAVHYARYASGLASLGLADAAREQARRGTEVDPGSAMAWAALGWLLERDHLGRPHRKGSDQKAALEAYKKALEVEPSANRRDSYADALRWSDEGELYGDPARVAEAARQYRLARQELHDEGGHRPITTVLLHAGAWHDAAQSAAREARDDERDARWIAATALDVGVASALELARREIADPAKRRGVLGTAARVCLSVRRYPEATAFITEAVKESGSQLDQALSRLIPRLRALPAEHDTPRTTEALVRELLARIATGRELRPLIAKGALSGDGDDGLDYLRSLRQALPFGVPPAVRVDVLDASSEVTVTGDERQGQAVKVVGSGGVGTFRMRLFVVREDDGPRLLGWGSHRSAVARDALRRARVGDLAPAIARVRWIAEGIGKPSSPDDEALFDLLRGLTASSKAPDVALVAAVACASFDVDGIAAEVITAALDKVSPALRRKLVLARVFAEQASGKLDAALADVDAYLADAPSDETALALRREVLTAAKRFDELLAHVRADVRANPHSNRHRLELHHVLRRLGRDAEARAVAAELLADAPDSGVYNGLAWRAIVDGIDLAQAVSWAEKAVESASGNRAGEINTLALAYVEVGRLRDGATQARLTVDALPSDEVDEGTWYVVGRIAEQVGLRDEALAAWKHIPAPGPLTMKDDVPWLAQVARKRLGER